MKEHIKINHASARDINLLLPILSEFRAHHSTDKLKQLYEAAFDEGYRIAYIRRDLNAVSFLGYRFQTYLFHGRTVKIDDLYTSKDFRNCGYARILFEWIIIHAKENQCEHLCLDSGFTRHEAYRFYLNRGLVIESMHFGNKLVHL